MIPQAILQKMPMVKSPFLFGRLFQIWDNVNPNEDLSPLLVAVGTEPEGARCRAHEVADFFKFSCGLSPCYAIHISNEFGLSLGRSEIKPDSEFFRGFLVGFLEGVGSAEVLRKPDQGVLGENFALIVALDLSKGTESSCYGRITNGAAAIFQKHPHFVSAFLACLPLFTPSTGSYAWHIVERFFHSIAGMREGSFLERVRALKELHDRVRIPQP